MTGYKVGTGQTKDAVNHEDVGMFRHNMDDMNNRGDSRETEAITRTLDRRVCRHVSPAAPDP